ncbi:hypothetical protein ACVNPZ_02355 [Staphylococcus aureus]
MLTDDSVIATFCYKIARNEEIQVNDRNVELTLNYVDDIVAEIKRAIEGIRRLKMVYLQYKRI